MVVVGVVALAACKKSGEQSGGEQGLARVSDREPRVRDAAAEPGCPVRFLRVGGTCVETTTCTPPPAVLDDEEKCTVALLEARRGAGDDCLITCMKAGEGRCVGGGCWHLCRTPMDTWKQPPGWSDCGR